MSHAEQPVASSAADGRPLRIRPAGRVVLLDPDDRVLLMRYDDGPPNGVHWSTPGGGLNPGEDFASGAARELAEETGWHDIVLLGEIYRWTHAMEYDDVIVRQVEHFYLARTISPSGRSRVSRRCTRPTASPRGAGGPSPDSTPPQRRSGRPSSRR